MTDMPRPVREALAMLKPIRRPEALPEAASVLIPWLLDHNPRNETEAEIWRQAAWLVHLPGPTLTEPHAPRDYYSIPVHCGKNPRHGVVGHLRWGLPLVEVAGKYVPATPHAVTIIPNWYRLDGRLPIEATYQEVLLPEQRYAIRHLMFRSRIDGPWEILSEALQGQLLDLQWKPDPSREVVRQVQFACTYCEGFNSFKRRADNKALTLIVETLDSLPDVEYKSLAVQDLASAVGRMDAGMDPLPVLQGLVRSVDRMAA